MSYVKLVGRSFAWSATATLPLLFAVALLAVAYQGGSVTAERGIRERPSPVVAAPRLATAPGEVWQPVTLAEAVALATVADREDWTACEILYGDTTFVRCPDGFKMSS